MNALSLYSGGCDGLSLAGSRVGMGRDRRVIIHEGLVCFPACRICHGKCHTSEQAFFEKEHIFGVKPDQYLCKVLGMNFEAS